MVSALHCSGMQDRCTPNAHYSLRSRQWKKNIWISGWYLTKLVIVQPPLCSGERGIQRSLSSCFSFFWPAAVATLQCSALCTHNVRFFEFVSVFIAKNWKEICKNWQRAMAWRVGFGSWYNARMKTTTTYSSWYLLEEHPACSLCI